MSPLARLIADEIRASGPIPFRRFMELALYHPDFGYYRRPADPFGREGDFFTNSQLQPVFGRIIAQQIEKWRHAMGRPEEFTVVELGAGRRETGAEIRGHLGHTRYIEVDIDSGEVPEAFEGVVFSNEFFDALPVHSVERRGGGWIEHYVDLGEEEFRWRESSLSDPALEHYLNRFVPPGLADGRKIEANLAALDHLEKVCRALRRGYILTIDYGYTAAELAAGRFPSGSLMSYEHHRAAEDVLADPGGRDITAHVNFTALGERGRELGWEPSALCTQAEFLLSIGEGDSFEQALAAASESKRLELRMQLKTLLFGLGETFRVLVQTR